jgi:hypothetical protein
MPSSLFTTNGNSNTGPLVDKSQVSSSSKHDDLIDSDDTTTTTTVSSATPSPDGFSYWVGVAFCVNYIMGCGFLSIPHRFVGAGVLLGPLVVAVFCVLMNISKDFMLEAMGR